MCSKDRKGGKGHKLPEFSGPLSPTPGDSRRPLKISVTSSASN